MKPSVVDTSAAYKWLCAQDEDNAREAGAMLERHLLGELVLVAPELLHVELASAVRHSPFIDEELGADIVRELDGYRIELVPATGERLAEALRLSYRHGISIYDALFLQLAEELDCPLVTVDRRAFAGVETRVEVRLL